MQERPLSREFRRNKSSLEPGQDKKRDGTIFIMPLYVDFINRYDINRHDEMVSVQFF